VILKILIIEKIIEAAKEAKADEFITKLSNSYDTALSTEFEKGTELSGGQWQRLAIARSFFRNSKLLILDEPTSAIDARAEKSIFTQIFHEEKDNTVIVISHRFSTVRKANKIIVLDQGKIIEEGSHEELMKKAAVYAEFYNAQTGDL
jgi:ATP-binding cassette subfamily B protein